MKLFWPSPIPKSSVVSLYPFQGRPRRYTSWEKASLPQPKPLQTPLEKKVTPSYPEWESAVQSALASFKKGAMEKVVLARKTVLRFAHPIDPFSLAAWLQGERSHGAHLFALQSGSFSMVGATPELLFRRDGKSLETMALAGTRRRGENRPFTEKEVREWSFVKDHIEKTLAPFCKEPLRLFSPSPWATFSVEHLLGRGQALLQEGVKDASLLKALHPTPALCGAPLREARRFLQREEPFSRGMYGGVLGWETEEASEWIVAIRCCTIRGSFVTLYAGAGIVAGSDPRAEWEELNAKERLFLPEP